MTFQWDEGNTRHVIEHYPERSNTVAEVESLFSDPNFAAIPDRVDSSGEQQYHAVATSNKNRQLYVVFSIRNGQIRPISCRPSSRKQRRQYAEIIQKTEQNSQPDNEES